MVTVICVGDISSLQNCCGVTELGCLDQYTGPRKEAEKVEATWKRHHGKSRVLVLDDKDDVQAKVKEFLRAIQNNYSAAFYQVWFVNENEADPDDGEEVRYGVYTCNTLRQGVQQLPNVVSLGEAVNPNSGNKIDGYLWSAE